MSKGKFLLLFLASACVTVAAQGGGGAPIHGTWYKRIYAEADAWNSALLQTINWPKNRVQCGMACKVVEGCSAFHHDGVTCQMADASDVVEDTEDQGIPILIEMEEPVDGGWSEWSDSGACNVTCGTGTRTQTRACDNPTPILPGADCLGESSRMVVCGTDPCPVDGGWSEWADSGAGCSVTCSEGTATEERTCDNPAPIPPGDDCAGELNRTVACDEGPCPVDGAWSEWADSGDCSVTCDGVGTRNQTRACDNPVPVLPGADCTGESTRAVACDEGPCPGGCLNEDERYVGEAGTSVDNYFDIYTGEHCAHLCYSVAECVYWWWKAADAKCKLIDSAHSGTVEPKDGFKRGFATCTTIVANFLPTMVDCVYKHTSFPTGNILEVNTEGLGMPVCARRCQHHATCAKWEYHETTGHCTLKDGSAAPEDFATELDAVPQAGVKVCPYSCGTVGEKVTSGVVLETKNGIESAEKCEEECTGYAGCTYYMYKTDAYATGGQRRDCVLYSLAADTESGVTGAISGPTSC